MLKTSRAFKLLVVISLLLFLTVAPASSDPPPDPDIHLNDVKLDPSITNPIVFVDQDQWEVHMVVDIAYEPGITQVSNLTVDATEAGGAIIINSRKVDPSIDSGKEGGASEEEYLDEPDDDPGHYWPDDDEKNNEYSNYPFSFIIEEGHGCVEITVSATHGDESDSATWEGILDEAGGPSSYYYFSYSDDSSSFQFSEGADDPTASGHFPSENRWQLHVCSCSQVTADLTTADTPLNTIDGHEIPTEWKVWKEGENPDNKPWESSWNGKDVTISAGDEKVVNFKVRMLRNEGGRLDHAGDYDASLDVDIDE